MAAPAPPAAALLQAGGIPPHLALLLARRGICDAEAASRFLKPSLADLHDPFLLAGMDEAVARLLAARERKEVVAVVGDYDVDGITATALLLAVFRACGLKGQPVIPHRLRDGYGFQTVHVERARALGCGLIVTADCGSSSAEAASAALACGIDVLVTDHHLPGGELPAGVLQINPRQAHCRYPFPDLAAVGLAFKLGLAFAARCGRALDPAVLLRVTCLGTIADLVPLLGENRVIAALGLAALASSRSLGLRALMREAGMKAPYTAADVGFRLGPRLNAAGRLHEPERALELLLSQDEKRCDELARELDAWNRERQAEEMRVVEEARAVFAERLPLPAILVAWNEGWHQGVVGVAAGRIAKELGRPTLLLARRDGAATGSGRSVAGVELHSFLARWRDQLLRFGGHSQAVGLSAAAERLETLRQEWEEAAALAWPEALLGPSHLYELAMAPSQVGAGLLAELGRLEPFGQGNPRPLLLSGPWRLAGQPRLFGKGHLAARAVAAAPPDTAAGGALVNGPPRTERRGVASAAPLEARSAPPAARAGAGASRGGEIDLVGWGWAERAEALAGSFEALGYLELDSFTGGPVLRLVDSRPAEGEPAAAIQAPLVDPR